MTQPISKMLSQPDEYWDKVLGVDERKGGHCDTHGDFIDLHYSGEGKISEGWRGCPDCHDEREQARMRDEERERQAQMYRDRLEQMVRNSGIPARFQGKTFDSYQAVNQKAGNHMKRVREYGGLLANKEHGGRCLILLGKVGNGKTHLGCALLAQVIRDTGQACHYWTFAELVRRVKGSFAKGAGYSEQDVYSDFARSYLVVLDEVGMQNFTDFEQAVAYEAINARYLAELPTVLITNLQANDLPLCVGERVVDRLREGGGRALDFDWKSYRQGGGE